jgi:hypothetical protein
LQGFKVVVKVKISDTEYYFGLGVITSVTYQGSAVGIATYAVEIAGDGDLVCTSNLISTVEPELIIDTLTNQNILNEDNWADYGTTTNTYQNDILIGKTITEVVVNGTTKSPSFDSVTGTLTFGESFNDQADIVVYFSGNTTYINSLLIGATVLFLTVNGILREDYTFNDATGTITFTSVLDDADILKVYYQS